MKRRFGGSKNYPELWLPLPLEVCMKTYSSFNQNPLLSTSLHRLPSLTLLLVTATLLAFAPQLTRADSQVPFRASFSTEVEIEFVYPFLYISVTGQGNASHMGATSAVTDNQVVNVETGSATATYTLTGANGDTVVLEMIFQTTFLPNNAVTFEGSYTVTEGTGRFYGATGSGDLAGSAMVTGPNTGIGSFSVAGTISSPGS
jgi:hypothetical protein